MPSSTTAQFDVLGLGNAIVDVLAQSTDAQLRQLGLDKGGMTLVSEERSAFLLTHMANCVEQSGGSVANSMAGLASLGGRAAFVGRVRDDRLGGVYRDDLALTGVRFDTPPASEGPATARSLIFVTEDAQRTMQTYLGACVELGPEDVDETMAAASAVTFLEGYLWDRPNSRAACFKAADACRAAGRKLALSLADRMCVDRWRDAFLEILRERADILIANENELLSLFRTDDLGSAIAQARSMVEIAATTRSERGAIVTRGEETIERPAVPPERLLDTTGAGDLWAAGFLRGLTSGLSIERSMDLGAHSATSILGQFGPRPAQSLAPLFEAA